SGRAEAAATAGTLVSVVMSSNQVFLPALPWRACASKSAAARPASSGESPRTGHTFNNGDLGAPMGDDAKPAYQIPLPQGPQGPGDPPRPYQVERLQRITQSAQDTNRNWQGALRNRNSVWQHYKLVLTQWPFTPSAPNQGAGGVNPLPQCAQRGGPATA